MQKEAKARLKINKLLEEAGWRLLDSPEGRANVMVEGYVKKIGKSGDDEFGDDYEKTYKGFVDYQLLNNDGFPVCVLEAKSEDKDPLVGKEQARDYADSQHVRFVILSNGNIHYFWDKETGNPTRISRFPSLKHLAEHKSFSPDVDKLVGESIDEDYIVLTQNPRYQQDPRWQDKKERPGMVEEQSLKFLRRYQLEAVKTIQKSVSEGKNRFLFEMATGTGKTLVAAAIIKLYLRSGNARRVLFLVDRLELETQAHKAFKKYLAPDLHAVIFKENRDDWRKAEVVVTTVQSLSYENKYLKLFSPNDFDLVVSDEAHRSISGNSRAIFEYFLSAKLGLTATPRDYLKNLNAAETDPRELERRTLLSTYKTFGCESGVPTFRYSLMDGVKDGFLVNPRAVHIETEITTQLLSEKGYAVQVETQGGEDEEVIYKQKDFERNFFSERTNHEFVKVFMENALKDPVTKEIGKTVFFCVSRKHASKITQALNEYAHKMYPGKYNSDFAVQVTSDIPSAQQMTINFVNNNLNGHTKFLEGYKSSKARVCVTVGMMTTGYDCEDILNLCMARPIFSPTDFIQIKGRGTRKFTFRFKEKGGSENALSVPKKNFKLFDFFANCKYFEEEYDYDQVIPLPPTGGEGGGPPGPLPKVTAVDIEDPLKILKEIVVDESGMRIDREMYRNKFESTVKDTYEKDSKFKEAVDAGDYGEMETFVRQNLFNKPEEFFSLDRVRQSYPSERRLGLWEILDKIFGRIQRFKTREELAEEEFEKYAVNETVPHDLFYESRELFKLYLIDENFRTTLNQNRLNEFASDPELIQIFKRLGKDRLARIPEYIKDNVSLNKFTN